MEMVPFIAGMLFLIPLMTGGFAKSFGRSYWKWFFIGCVAPGLSFFLLYWATAKDEEQPEEPAPEANDGSKETEPDQKVG